MATAQICLLDGDGHLGNNPSCFWCLWTRILGSSFRLLRLAISRAMESPVVSVVLLGPLIALWWSPLPLRWLPLAGVFWMALGVYAWGISLGVRPRLLTLGKRAAVVAVCLGMLLLLVDRLLPPSAAASSVGIAGRWIALLLPLWLLSPALYLLFPGAADDRPLADQFRGLKEFLLFGWTGSRTIDSDGAMRVEWATSVAMISSLTLLPWLLRGTIFLFPALFFQALVSGLLFPFAWSFWQIATGRLDDSLITRSSAK